jgi:methyl-accepting chemotaxis protein
MILMYCCSLVAIVTIVVTNNIIQQRKRRNRVLWVTLWVQQLRGLLELFPKHRGMANAFLKGDDSFRPSMEKLQREVDTKLLSMRQLIAERGDWSERHLLQPIERQWQSIKESVFNMPATKSFALHTQLISLVIERMEDDSLELEAFAQNYGHLKSLITLLTRELPHVVESIGQARGIGTGVAAQRSSTVANRVNMKFLHGNTLSIINNKLVPVRSVLHQFHSIEDHGVKDHGMEEFIDSTVSSAQNFLNLLHSELIDTAHPTVSPETFYQQGTAAIDAGFRLFDQLFPRCIQFMGLR